jgi:hypothetical protein
MKSFFSQLQHSTRLALALSALAAVLGMGLVIFSTTAGPGVGGDATIYLTTARNLLHGQGLGWTEADGSYRLLPYSPPFYPLALSAAGLLVGDMSAAARWLNVLLVGSAALLAGWGFFRATRRAWLAGIVAGLLALSPVLLGVQVWAISETLFLLLGFGGLGLLLAWLESGQRRFWLFSALLVGLAALTRYAGVAYIGAGALAIVLLAPGPARARWGQAVRYGLLASLPLLAWLVVDVLLTGSVGSRSGQPAAAYWQRFLEICPALESIYLFWLLPDSLAARLPGILRTAAWLVPVAGIAAAWMWLWRGSSAKHGQPAAPGEKTPARLAIVMALFIGVYLLVLALVQVFTYPPVTLASRMLSPVHAAALVLLAALAAWAFARFEVRPARLNGLVSTLVYLGLLAVLGSYAARSALIAREYQRTGIGYNAPTWRAAPIMNAVRSLPANVALVSNETTALMYLVDRPAYAVQEIFAQQPQADFTQYGVGDDPAQRAFREGAALVLFNATLHEDFAMYGERVDERLAALTRGLRPVYQGEDGAIYFWP